MKETFNTLILIFTRFATAIFLIDSIALISFKGREAKLFATDILAILGIALLCAVFYILLLSDRNISKKKMLIMQLAYFAIINTIVLIAGLLLKWFSFCKLSTFFIFESVIIGVISITVLYSYKSDSATAKKMTEKLKKLESEEKKQ